MVLLYSGTPGSGKSLHVAYEIIEHLWNGWHVIANFPIDMSYFKRFKRKPKGHFHYIQNRFITVKVLKKFAKNFHTPFKEHQTLLVLDECGMMFNPRAWKEQDRMSWLEFFSQHRKLGYDCILISQADMMLDKQIRCQIEEEHKHRAVKNYKTFGWLLSLLTGGLFMDVVWWYPCKMKTGCHFFRFDGSRAKIYDTFKIFE